METAKSDFSLFHRITRIIKRHIKPIINIIYYKIFKISYFIFNGTELSYYYSLHNETFKNERSIEIPIAMHYVQLHKCKKILEVGNVLSHYFQFEHTIIDKYERRDSVLNYDITDYISNEKFDLIITISTLEHVGWDEYTRYGDNTTKKHNDPTLLLVAINNLRKMLNPNGIIIATMPLGFNNYLDSVIESKKLDFSEMYFMKRISKNNKWKQVPYAEVRGTKYSDPYPCANGVMIGIYHSD